MHKDATSLRKTKRSRWLDTTRSPNLQDDQRLIRSRSITRRLIPSPMVTPNPKGVTGVVSLLDPPKSNRKSNRD
ncbi:hypothetical protein EVAR_25010_1 [Eumeta japonica]|uniref:Uncharacterized protein n=1 Tax=Eumeta variegata TaxID=151549 RepID=A0A4C1V6Y2_EUMVA|nr:hypothetical protein EVAR_25010_1 [Eumeta japonica]